MTIVGLRVIPVDVARRFDSGPRHYPPTSVQIGTELMVPSTKIFEKAMSWGLFTHPMFDDRLAEIAANWWAERFMVKDKREEFKDALKARLLEVEPDPCRGPALSIYSDYDPDETLLAAIHDIGIECRGCLFSSEGLLPCKTGLTLSKEGELWAKEGYGERLHRIDK